MNEQLLITTKLKVCIIFAVRYMDNPGLTFGWFFEVNKSFSW